MRLVFLDSWANHRVGARFGGWKWAIVAGLCLLMLASPSPLHAKLAGPFLIERDLAKSNPVLVALIEANGVPVETVQSRAELEARLNGGTEAFGTLDGCRVSSQTAVRECRPPRLRVGQSSPLRDQVAAAVLALAAADRLDGIAATYAKWLSSVLATPQYDHNRCDAVVMAVPNGMANSLRELRSPGDPTVFLDSHYDQIGGDMEATLLSSGACPGGSVPRSMVVYEMLADKKQVRRISYSPFDGVGTTRTFAGFNSDSSEASLRDWLLLYIAKFELGHTNDELLKDLGVDGILDSEEVVEFLDKETDGSVVLVLPDRWSGLFAREYVLTADRNEFHRSVLGSGYKQKIIVVEAMNRSNGVASGKVSPTLELSATPWATQQFARDAEEDACRFSLDCWAPRYVSKDREYPPGDALAWARHVELSRRGTALVTSLVVEYGVGCEPSDINKAVLGRWCEDACTLMSGIKCTGCQVLQTSLAAQPAEGVHSPDGVLSAEEGVHSPRIWAEVTGGALRLHLKVECLPSEYLQAVGGNTPVVYWGDTESLAEGLLMVSGGPLLGADTISIGGWRSSDALAVELAYRKGPCKLKLDLWDKVEETTSYSEQWYVTPFGALPSNVANRCQRREISRCGKQLPKPDGKSFLARFTIPLKRFKQIAAIDENRFELKVAEVTSDLNRPVKKAEMLRTQSVRHQALKGEIGTLGASIVGAIDLNEPWVLREAHLKFERKDSNGTLYSMSSVVSLSEPLVTNDGRRYQISHRGGFLDGWNQAAVPSVAPFAVSLEAQLVDPTTGVEESVVMPISISGKNLSNMLEQYYGASSLQMGSDELAGLVIGDGKCRFSIEPALGRAKAQYQDGHVGLRLFHHVDGNNLVLCTPSPGTRLKTSDCSRALRAAPELRKELRASYPDAKLVDASLVSMNKADGGFVPIGCHPDLKFEAGNMLLPPMPDMSSPPVVFSFGEPLPTEVNAEALCAGDPLVRRGSASWPERSGPANTILSMQRSVTAALLFDLVCNSDGTVNTKILATDWLQTVEQRYRDFVQHSGINWEELAVPSQLNWNHASNDGPFCAAPTGVQEYFDRFSQENGLRRQTILVCYESRSMGAW